MINAGMMTSNTDMWATPQPFFDVVNAEFGFTLDVCVTPENAKCGRYFTPEINGLAQRWEGIVWCNPPYGRQIGAWIKKAYESSRAGATVIMLIPARTDTRWFHRYVLNKAEIRFIKNRLYFGSGEGRAPFPSMLIVFQPISIRPLGMTYDAGRIAKSQHQPALFTEIQS